MLPLGGSKFPNMAKMVSTFSSIKTGKILAGLLLSGALFFAASCNKDSDNTTAATNTEVVTSDDAADRLGGGASHQALRSIVTVADIRSIAGSKSIEVMFNENTQFFTVSGEALISRVKEALAQEQPLKIAFDPWQGVLLSAAAPSATEQSSVNARGVVSGRAGARNIDLADMDNEVIDNASEMGIINTTDPGLNNLIPDFATAQLMFDYITRQCCELPGPYAIDYCIPFQYCIDGCYARAHKMCWIINNRYKYGTKKIFSFANSGSDKLCVQGQKWGGCCIRWWYHVAPLVTIKTPTGPKAYVFDPAMFNQPVLLSTWLHAQENPTCAASFTPHVSMINVQPTSSYSPSGSTGLLFHTDPAFSSTNYTLSNYSALITCP